MTALNKMNLNELKKQLNKMEKELQSLGSPMTHIRKIHDLESSFKWLEKHRSNSNE